LPGAPYEYSIPKSRADRSRGNDVLPDFRLDDLLFVELASLSKT